MPSIPGLPNLPYLTAGVAAPVTRLLAAAGVPLLRLDSAMLAAAAQPPANFVLYDSRSDTGCAGLRLAARYALPSVDIAAVWGSIRHGENDQPGMLARLKSEIERRNGVWARIADCPYPFRCALCLASPKASDALPGFEETFRIEIYQPRSIEARYTKALPMVTREAAACDSPLVGDDEYPLLWKATLAEFADWWAARERITLKLWWQAGGARIECQGLPAGYCPALEIWRGNHVARIAIDSESLNLDMRGIVYACETSGSPGGLAPYWTLRNSPQRIVSTGN